MPDFYGQPKDINATDIPFFAASVRPTAELRFSAAHSESHISRRHLNELLNAEDVAGIELDENAVRKHADRGLLLV